MDTLRRRWRAGLAWLSWWEIRYNVTVKVIIFIFITILFVIAGAVLRSAADSTDGKPPWSQEYVEERWGQPPEQTNLYKLTYGWDWSGRYFVTRWKPEHQHIIVIDRNKHRTCVLGVMGSFNTGLLEAGKYSIYSSIQSFHSESISLDLSTWEVTSVVTGVCVQWSCSELEKPETESKGVCEPDKVYGPYGFR